MESAGIRNRVVQPGPASVWTSRLASVWQWLQLLLAACFMVWTGTSVYFFLAFHFWVAVLLSSFSLIFVLFIVLLPVLSIIGSHLDTNR